MIANFNGCSATMTVRTIRSVILLCCIGMVGCHGNAPPDEAKAAGKSAADFPAATFDYFAEMDQNVISSGETTQLANLRLDEQAIIGRNAWMMWTGGNEAFWDWLARHGYGTLDFLQLLDSNQRHQRFTAAGLISEPGMRGPDDAETKASFGIRFDRPANPESQQPDPRVYGYPSGIVGLRIFPNPNFQGVAAKRWDADRYYRDPSYAANPQTIRPYRVGMSCAFCHAGPHPLNPPSNVNAPEWANLSGTIGSQYMRARAVFGNKLTPDNFLYQALNVQLPGTIDTSLVAADNINNASTMNAIFEVPERVARSRDNARETLDEPAKTYPGIWTHTMAETWNTNPRPVPRILADGSDSVGIYLSLARVYLNIGTYHEQWIRLHNPLLGLRKQAPFKLADCENNSVYWIATKARVEPIAEYFLKSTAPMKLSDAPEGRSKGNLQGSGRPWDPAYADGRKVFARGCIACHSSVQPGDREALEAKIKVATGDRPRTSLRLEIEDLWRLADGDGELPESYTQWSAEAVEYQEFWDPNFLSTDMRLPVTMIGTNSARALATNATRGHVWNDFSSQTYKALDSPGQIHYRDPFSGTTKSFRPSKGGPGYYRPPSLVSLWATAPFLHNNALGKFNNDPSVEGRLDAYDDAIRKLLWPELRKPQAQRTSKEVSPLDRYVIGTANSDSSLIFRGYQIPDLFAGFTGWPPSVIGFVPWVPSILFVLIGVLLWLPSNVIRDRLQRRAPRWETTVAKLAPFATWLLFLITAAWLFTVWQFAPLLAVVESASHWRIPFLRIEAFLFPIMFLAFGAWLLRGWWRSPSLDRGTRGLSAICLMAAIVFAAGFGPSLSGHGDDIIVGPFPAGMPVNLLANMDPEAPLVARIKGITSLLQYLREWHHAPRDQKPGLKEFSEDVAPVLMAVSQCPDFVIDRGHDFEFMRAFSDEEKESLIELLKTF
jgi:cytochrome c5